VIGKIGGGVVKALKKGVKTKTKSIGTKIKPVQASQGKIVVGKAPKKTYASKNAMRADLDKNARSGFTGYTPKATSKQNKYKQNMKSFLGSK
jgi:hypothetical protein